MILLFNVVIADAYRRFIIDFIIVIYVWKIRDQDKLSDTMILNWQSNVTYFIKIFFFLLPLFQGNIVIRVNIFCLLS